MAVRFIFHLYVILYFFKFLLPSKLRLCTRWSVCCTVYFAHCVKVTITEVTSEAEDEI